MLPVAVKPVPVIVMVSPIAAEVGDTFVSTGAGPVGVVGVVLQPVPMVTAAAIAAIATTR